jgi:hypothetical protein
MVCSHSVLLRPLLSLVLLLALLGLLLAWLVLLLALDSEDLVLTLAWAVLLLAPAPAVLPPVSVVLLVSVVVIAVFRAMFAVSKALQPMPMATLHAMAAALVRGETATGEAMASMCPAVTAIVIPMPMTAATIPTATGDTGALWFAPKTDRGRRRSRPALLHTVWNMGQVGENVRTGQPNLTVEAIGRRWLSFNAREDWLHGLTVARPLTWRARAWLTDAAATELLPLGPFATWQAQRAAGVHDRNTLRLHLDLLGDRPA